ncbi:helix-turn-helix transcriptional regulator [Roseateles toxinivorans]|uniref:helix-turn-helix transcriptional regulator n=1 Tax=Roseateles toxinivorans TaxID=270368 RepID=UPI001AAC4831|nr:helix-turn-helix transcriptional regulator [Roseateles toxinivorans]
MQIAPALLPHNALLLDLQMHLLSCSDGARAVLAANAEVLGLLRGRLVARGQQASLAEQLVAGQSLTLTRKGRPSLSVLAQIITDSQDQPLAVLATLVDPMNQRMDRRLLPGLFGLTTTEARIAAALADGQGTHQIAAELGVQLNTVHAHVKKLLAKTHTQRQVQLVSLLWRSVSVLTAHPPRLSMSDLLPPRVAGEPPRGDAPDANSGNDASLHANQTEAG